MKSILLPLTNSIDAGNITRIAAELATRHQGSLTGMFIRLDPRMAIPFMGEGLTADMIQQLCDTAEKEGKANAAKAESAFRETVGKMGLKLLSEGQKAEGARARWREVIGQVNDHAGRAARTSDLTVCVKPDAEMPDSDDIFHDLIFRSGRSVLMVPAAYSGAVGRHVMIAWNGRAEGARAVGGAIPLLLVAEKVTIVQIGDIDPVRPDFEDVEDYLEEYGIKATTRNDKEKGDSIGNQLLGTAGQIGADCIVLGAYSHSRWREMVLGGATRHIVSKSTLPIFMSH
ncbi:universal stress protein [Kordiimonas aestuarii]|uniref:universal stress protein n=1 Tax=Kordiimonas aestuarii TaxID=1005925 RepID=UPI0021D17FE6|nr:universal stress protein [Kordiimonas aestuarii]